MKRTRHESHRAVIAEFDFPNHHHHQHSMQNNKHDYYYISDDSDCEQIINYSLDRVDSSNDESEEEEEVIVVADDASLSEKDEEDKSEEQDLEYDLPLALRNDYLEEEFVLSSALKKQKLNNSTLNVSTDNFIVENGGEGSDDYVSDSDKESNNEVLHFNPITHLEDLQKTYFKKTGGIYLKETRPRLYAIKLGSIIVKEKINGKLCDCDKYMVAKIGSTELLNDRRINKLIGGLVSLGLKPQLIDTRIIFPKGLPLNKWESDWRIELALKSFTKEEMLELGLSPCLGPSEYILMSSNIDDKNATKLGRELYLFKDKTFWTSTKNTLRNGCKLETGRPCAQCGELVYKSYLPTCHYCSKALCDHCSLQCDCCEQFFCAQTKECSTKCDICDTIYCSYCVPKCEVCHEFCCSEQCSTILPCECAVICIDCNVKKPKSCQECQTPICSKCGIRCDGCNTLGCNGCISKCSNCLERFCQECGIESCYICGKELCQFNCHEMISQCRSCGNDCCHDCTSKYTKKTRTCTECKS